MNKRFESAFEFDRDIRQKRQWIQQLNLFEAAKMNTFVRIAKNILMIILFSPKKDYIFNYSVIPLFVWIFDVFLVSIVLHQLSKLLNFCNCLILTSPMHKLHFMVSLLLTTTNFVLLYHLACPFCLYFFSFTFSNSFFRLPRWRKSKYFNQRSDLKLMLVNLNLTLVKD